MRIDVIYSNGRFETLDELHPRAHRVGVADGRIAGVDDELEGVSANTEINLAGQPVVPGFNDAHRHLLIESQRINQLNLSSSAGANPESILEAVGKRAQKTPNSWILGYGYDLRRLKGSPSAQVLESVAGQGTPVWLEDHTGHVGIASTSALERAGLTHGGKPSELVELDDDGRPSGLVKEQAVGLMRRSIGSTPACDLVELLGQSASHCASQGITSITEAGLGATLGLGDGPRDIGVFSAASKQGKLPVRATLMPFVTVPHGIEEVAEFSEWRGLDLGIGQGFGNEWLRIGPVKVLLDGSLRACTAAMTQDYHGFPGERGVFQFAPKKYRRKIAQLHKSGWQIATHAIGDSAVETVIDAYEQVQKDSPRRNARHRIEHGTVMTDAQVHRLGAAGIVAVPQGAFITEMGDAALAVLGFERARLAHRMKSLINAGVVLAGSSDAPVANGSPLVGIDGMVNRRTAEGVVLNPDEALTPREALVAYTYGSAYAAGEERFKGKLRRGQLADFTVLSDDLLRVHRHKIKDLSVGATVLGGEIVYNCGAID